MSRRIAFTAALAALAASAPRPALAGSYRWPTTYGAYVTAHYDNNDGSGAPLDWQCGGNSYSGHRGTDIGVAKYTDVFAGAAGWVKKSADGYGDGYIGSTDGGGFGNHVAIYHGAGDETIYGHLSAGTGIPAMGTTLACSDKIGQSGTSGNSSGPHLHFETRVGVDETGSYYSGAADDPYAGPCSGPLSYWADQADGTPTTDCAGAPPPPDACGGLTAQGVCEGQVLRWCEGGAIMEADCAAQGQVCGWQDDTIGNNCLDAPDGDGDGVPLGPDCDDADPAIHAGAAESCNGIDDDCSGAADEGLMRVCDNACQTGLQLCVDGAWGACDEICPGDPDGDGDGDGDGGDPNTVGGGCSAAGAGRVPPSRGLWLLVLAVPALLAWRRRRRARR